MDRSQDSFVSVGIAASKLIDISYLWVISGFRRALLQSITFISRINALDYTKLRS